MTLRKTIARRWPWIIAILGAIFIFSSWAWAEEQEKWLTINAYRPSNVIIHCKDGTQTIFDFSADPMTVSGDCPIDESARVFFEHVFRQYKDCCPCGEGETE